MIDLYFKYPIVRYLFNLFLYLPFLLIDFTFNTLMGGSPQETISGRMGRNPDHWFSKIICPLLDKIDYGHCEKWANPDAHDEEVSPHLAIAINAALIAGLILLF